MHNYFFDNHRARSPILAHEVGTLDPKPGLPPTTSHLSAFLTALGKEPAKAVVRSAYSDPLAASVALLLLAADPHGAAHLQELLAGQILWANPHQLVPVAIASAAILGVWLTIGSRHGPALFYLLFAGAVTLSVQLVGLYLVFTTLIVPALATRSLARGRLAAGYCIGVLGYAVGLVNATWLDLPAGPTAVCSIAVVGLLIARLFRTRAQAMQPR